MRPVRVAANVPPVDVATNVAGDTVPNVPVENPVKDTVVSALPVEVRVPLRTADVPVIVVAALVVTVGAQGKVKVTGDPSTVGPIIAPVVVFAGVA